MYAVKKGDIEKVTKAANKGLDPNFIDLESGGGQSVSQSVRLRGPASLAKPARCVLAVIQTKQTPNFQQSPTAFVWPTGLLIRWWSRSSHVTYTYPSCKNIRVMPQPHRAEALSDAFVWRQTSVWRLSVAYIGLKSRTESPIKTKICTEVAHVTRDSDTTF